MDDDLVEIHMSEWPLVAIASQMHQHLQQVITHLSTMRSHYNPPPLRKNALYRGWRCRYAKESGDQWTNCKIFLVSINVGSFVSIETLMIYGSNVMMRNGLAKEAGSLT